MKKLISVAAVCVGLAGVLAGPAMAQKPGDKLAKLVSGPDRDIVKEAVETVHAPGECTVLYVVGKDGKTKDIKPDCDNEAYNPYVVRAIESMTYEPEIFDGEIFESEPIRQAFKFGVEAAPEAAKPPGDTPPVPIKTIEPRDVKRALDRVNEDGTCELSYTVTAAGKTADIVPNCTPSAYDPYILDAAKKLTFKPGQNAGQAIDWPNVQLPLNLSKKK
jgi:hypothetical protein